MSYLIVAIPVCHKDFDLVMRNLERCIKLDGSTVHHALVAYDSVLGDEKGKEVVAKAKLYFSTVSSFLYNGYRGPDTWPGPQNYAWQNTARHFESLAPNDECSGWLWWESDAYPLKPHWLDVLHKYHRKSRCHFFGHIVDGKGHMNGVAIYPFNISDYVTNAMLVKTSPFDVTLSSEIKKPGKIGRANEFIFHAMKWKGGGPSSPISSDAILELPSTAVLYHGVFESNKSLPSNFKSGSGSKVTVVITNFKRPDFLKAAFDSCLRAGVSNIVVTSSGATKEIFEIHASIKAKRPDVIIVSEQADSGNNFNWLAGVRAATTEWVTILHDDDLICPEFQNLERQISPGPGFYLWNARQHGMGVSGIVTTMAGETGIRPSTKLLSTLLNPSSFSLSPVAGCFKRKDLMEVFNECSAHFGGSFFVRENMMVGNDLMIWLRMIQKHKFVGFLNQPMVSFGHHPKSVTCDDVLNNRGRLSTLYNKTRDYFLKSHRRVIHITPSFDGANSETKTRNSFAEESWRKIYDMGLGIHLNGFEPKRNSCSIEDARGTSFLKDQLGFGFQHLNGSDILLFTNNDTVLHSEFVFMLLDFMRNQNSCCSFRSGYKKGKQPDLISEKPFVDSDAVGTGRDVFAFTRDWLEENMGHIPDYVLGSNDWDSTLATIIRMSKGISVTKETWLTPDPSCELPSGFVYHEDHEAEWSTPTNRQKLPGNVYNRGLTLAFREKLGVGWHC